jgi:hypothetical protein
LYAIGPNSQNALYPITGSHIDSRFLYWAETTPGVGYVGGILLFLLLNTPYVLYLGFNCCRTTLATLRILCVKFFDEKLHIPHMKKNILNNQI